MVYSKNSYIKNCYVYSEEDLGYKCKLNNGCCNYKIKGEKFHTGNAKSHLTRKHGEEYNNILSCNQIIKTSSFNNSQCENTIFEERAKIRINTSKKECINNLISIFSQGGKPFNLCDEPGFQYFVAPYLNYYDITLNKITVQEFIRCKAKKREKN